MFSSKVSRRPESSFFARVKAAGGRTTVFTMLLLGAAMTLGLYGLSFATRAGAPQLQIESVFADATTQKIVINGQNFNIGSGPLTVLLFGTLTNLGNLTPVCTLGNVNMMPQTITCDLSGGNPPFPAAGDYLLMVSDGNLSTEIDSWDLTVEGPLGPTGQLCPPGQCVVGFDSTGHIVCHGCFPTPSPTVVRSPTPTISPTP